MQSESTRTRIWQTMYDAIRLSRYYADLGSLYSKIQAASHSFVLLASMGAIASLLEQIEWGMIASGVAVALSAVISTAWANPSRLAAILSASARCRVLEIEALELWHQLVAVDDEEAARRWTALSKKLEEATVPVEMAGIGFSKRRNEQSAHDARSTLELTFDLPKKN